MLVYRCLPSGRTWALCSSLAFNLRYDVAILSTMSHTVNRTPIFGVEHLNTSHWRARAAIIGLGATVFRSKVLRFNYATSMLLIKWIFRLIRVWFGFCIRFGIATKLFNYSILLVFLYFLLGSISYYYARLNLILLLSITGWQRSTVLRWGLANATAWHVQRPQ